MFWKDCENPWCKKLCFAVFLHNIKLQVQYYIAAYWYMYDKRYILRMVLKLSKCGKHILSQVMLSQALASCEPELKKVSIPKQFCALSEGSYHGCWSAEDKHWHFCRYLYVWVQFQPSCVVEVLIRVIVQNGCRSFISDKAFCNLYAVY